MATGNLVTKDLIAQHNLTDGEYMKFIEITGRTPSYIGMDS
jgi:hypothetical protein